MIAGNKFRVLGTSDYPICDCCGKTNLTRSVGLENESGDTFTAREALAWARIEVEIAEQEREYRRM